MEPKRNTNAGLVDLLDRILNKGLVLNADVIISVSGIPLLGLNLKAALAGMDTMLKYGIWEDWDAAQRAWAAEERRRPKLDQTPLQEGEVVLLKAFGTHWYSKGIYRNWRPGDIYVTNRRIFSYRKLPAEVLFTASYGDIHGMGTEQRENIAKKETGYLYIVLKNGEIIKLHPADAYALKDTIMREMNELGFSCQDMSLQDMPLIDDNANKLLKDGEKLMCCEKMWHLEEVSAPRSKSSGTWKSGRLWLTSDRMFWQDGFNDTIAFDAPLSNISAARIETKDLSGFLGIRPALLVDHRGGTACFSGDACLMEKFAVNVSNVAEDEESETCPSCRAKAPVRVLLSQGCKTCGWVSPRMKKPMVRPEQILAPLPKPQ